MGQNRATKLQNVDLALLAKENLATRRQYDGERHAGLPGRIERGLNALKILRIDLQVPDRRMHLLQELLDLGATLGVVHGHRHKFKITVPIPLIRRQQVRILGSAQS